MLDHKQIWIVRSFILICFYGCLTSVWAQDSLKSNERNISCRLKLVRFDQPVLIPNQAIPFRALFHLAECKSEIRIDGDMSAPGYFEIYIRSLSLESKVENRDWKHEQNPVGSVLLPSASLIIKSRGQGWFWSPPLIFEAGKLYRIKIKANDGSIELLSQPFHFLN
jgi:hypothetical protein